jgi:dTMP kinase
VVNRISGGILLTLEGPDGAGKSTQAALLAERIRATGREVVLTREPGGTPLGEAVRGVLLAATGEGRDPLTDAFLFNAARYELVGQVIRPALDRGAVVICDRFTDSTLAYQGYGAGVPIETLRALANIATDGLRPDRTILFDLPAEAGLRRRTEGEQSDVNRFESADQHGLAFHERVRAGYLELAEADPGRWRVIDAGRDPEAVSSDLWKAARDLVGIGR